MKKRFYQLSKKVAVLITVVTCALLTTNQTFAQGVRISGTAGNAPHADAILDLTNSLSKGFLVPQVANVGSLPINPTATGAGMIFYVSGTGYYYWDGSAWQTFGTGPTGPTGPAGAVGATGAAGAVGATGPAGDVGATGPAGSVGPTGAAGPSGSQGATGPSGDVGTPGPAGAPGAQGPTGPTGLLGAGSATGNTTYWDGTQWVLSSNNIYNNGANVGIGTGAAGVTTLEVGGGFSTKPATPVAAGATITIPANVSVIRITDNGAVSANDASATLPQEGQRLTIYNNDAQVVTFPTPAGTTIAASTGVAEFQYINGGWRMLSNSNGTSSSMANLSPDLFGGLTLLPGNYNGSVATTVGIAADGIVSSMIAAGAVANSDLANMPANTIKGNNTVGATAPLDLTPTQTTAMLDVFTSALKGLAPASAGGTANYLRADGTWAPPAGTTYTAGNGLTLTGTQFSLTAPVSIANGGTALGTTPTNGQLLIGNNTGYTLATLTAGTGTSITNGGGSITINNTGVTSVGASLPLTTTGGTTPTIRLGSLTANGSANQMFGMNAAGTDVEYKTVTAGTAIGVTNGVGTITINNNGVTSITAGTAIGISGGTGAVTINNTGVTSFSGGTTGLTATPASTGAVSLTGTLIVGNGGTGLTSGTQWGIPYFNTTTSMLSSAAGSGVLVSTGTSAPVFTPLDLVAWKVGGNAGTTAGTNYVGTSDAVDFVAATNGVERMRLYKTADGGGVKIVNRVGIGGLTDAEVIASTAKLDIDGDNASTLSLQLRSGNFSNTYGATQIAFSQNGLLEARHAIKTRHQTSSVAGNTFDFFIWRNGDNVNNIASKRVMTIDGAGGLSLLENDATPANSQYYTRIVSGDQTADLTLTLPTTAGSNGNVLSTNGAGTLTWVTAPTGTNTGDVTLAAIGSTPNANGATLAGQVLNLEPANATNGGVVTTGTQTFAGDKTFSGITTVSNATPSTTTTNGALIVAGGVGVAGTVNANILMSATGTAAAPGHSFTGDTDNGMYLIAANTLGLSANGAEKIRMDANGVTIGYTGSAPNNNLADATNILRVNGKVRTTGVNESSDLRWKKNIVNIDGALNKVLSMNGRYYDWKTSEFPGNNFSKGRQVGVIAQEIEKILPEVVSTDGDGYKAVEYSHIVPVLIEAIKEQQKIIDGQNLTITDLKASLENVLSRVNIMEKNFDINSSKVEK